MFQSTHLAWHTEAGRRSNNEDFCATVLAPDQRSALLVVADGMGGHAAGEVAARIVVDEIVQAYNLGNLKGDSEFMLQTILRAHDEVSREARESPEREGMGATVVIAHLIEPTASAPAQVIVGHIGDSRAIQFRAGCVRRLTRDHLFAIDVLGVDEEMAKHHPQGNVLSQAIGTSGKIAPTVNSFDLEPGDLILLCTDGVSEMLPESEMDAIIFGLLPPKTESIELDTELPYIAAEMVGGAIRRGSRDNCTVALAMVPVRTEVAAPGVSGRKFPASFPTNASAAKPLTPEPTQTLKESNE